MLFCDFDLEKPLAKLIVIALPEELVLPVHISAIEVDLVVIRPILASLFLLYEYLQIVSKHYPREACLLFVLSDIIV